MNKSVTNNQIQKKSPAQLMTELDKVKEDLLAKRGSTTEVGEIADIDAALEQVSTAQQTLAPKIEKSKATITSERTEQNANFYGINPSPQLSPRQHEQIAAIKNVQGASLKKGDVFSSLNGHGLANNDYMRKNINGLFELTALKG